MKTTKRIIAASAKTSAVYQRIMADKKALKEHCASLGTALTNDKKGTESVCMS